VRVPQQVHDQRGEEIADGDMAAGMRHRRPRLGCPKFRLNRTDAPSQYPPQRHEWKVTHLTEQIAPDYHSDISFWQGADTERPAAAGLVDM
jgi:hypothetical protein